MNHPDILSLIPPHPRDLARLKLARIEAKLKAIRFSKRDLPTTTSPGLHAQHGHFRAGANSPGYSTNRNRRVNLHRPWDVSLAPQRRVGP